MDKIFYCTSAFLATLFLSQATLFGGSKIELDKEQFRLMECQTVGENNLSSRETDIRSSYAAVCSFGGYYPLERATNLLVKVFTKRENLPLEK